MCASGRNECGSVVVGAEDSHVAIPAGKGRGKAREPLRMKGGLPMIDHSSRR